MIVIIQSCIHHSRNYSCRYGTGRALSSQSCSMIVPFESVVGSLHFCYFLCRPHLRVLLYAGELLKRPNTKLQMDSNGADSEKL